MTEAQYNRKIMKTLHDAVDLAVSIAEGARESGLISALELKELEVFHEAVKDAESTWADVDLGPAPF